MNYHENSICGYITVREYARRHEVSEAAVRQKIYRGYLPAKKVGEGNHGLLFIKESEPWENHKPGVKKGTKVRHRRTRAEMQELRRKGLIK